MANQPLTIDLSLANPSVDPTLGSNRLPSGTKSSGRADFQDKSFDKFIEEKGVRVAWSRAAACPCLSANIQTLQPDPNCSLCTTKAGLTYFRDPSYNTSDAEVGDLDALQQVLVDRTTSPGIVVKALLQSAKMQTKMYTDYGVWGTGTALLTVRKDITPSKYDRFTILDQVLSYTENLESTGAALLTPSFPAVRIDRVQTTASVYDTADYLVTEAGELCITGNVPTEGTYVSVTYLYHPQYLVVGDEHAIRGSLNNTKLGREGKTPLGDPQPLPRQVMVQLEYLVS
jgi:hypothetical protein